MVTSVNLAAARGEEDRRQFGGFRHAGGCINRRLRGITLCRSGEIHRRQSGTVACVVFVRNVELAWGANGSS